MPVLLTQVSLTPEQATLFRIFMQHYDTISFMEQFGCFDIIQGSATIHFDKIGKARSLSKTLNTSLTD